MNISKKSWHYRLVKEVSSYDPSESLCLYFWQVVWAIIQVLSAILAVILTVLVLGYVMLYALGFKAFVDGLPMYCSLPLLIACGVGVVVCAFSAIGCVLWLREKNTREYVIVEYIKAKKNKICPKIDFED